MRLVQWQCDNCGATQDFPHNEQPLAYFKCLMGTWKRAICGGTIKPTYDGKPGSANDGGTEHGG